MIRIFGEESYENAVLNKREANFSSDSDFYATVWDEETQTVREIQVGTTRFPSDYFVEIDATPEVIEKALKYYNNILLENRENIVEKTLRMEKRRIDVGDTIEVIKGRKVAKGTTGKLVGYRENRYSYDGYNPRVVLELEDGTRVNTYKVNISRVVNEAAVEEAVNNYKIEGIGVITDHVVHRIINSGIYLENKIK